MHQGSSGRCAMRAAAVHVNHLGLLVLLTAAALSASATYIPWASGRAAASAVSPLVPPRAGDKANAASAAADSNSDESRASSSASSSLRLHQKRRRHRHRAFFKDDAEIYRYLKGQGRQLMLWRCRNAIQASWKRRPLPFIDLYCEVIGAVQSGTWSHRGRNIAGNTGSVADNSLLTSENDDDIRYRYTIETHSDRGRYYSAWLDFRLRIHNATERDSGVYRFAVVGPSGDVDEQAVYVDISYSARSSSVYGKAKPRDAGQKKGANEQAVAVRSGSMDDDGARNRRSEAAAAAAAEMDDGHEAG